MKDKIKGVRLKNISKEGLKDLKKRFTCSHNSSLPDDGNYRKFMGRWIRI